MSVFEVEINELENLTDKQLVSLLNRLLRIEAINDNIALSGISVCPNLNASNGGIDGEFEGNKLLLNNDFLPSEKVIFQIKATKMPLGECYKEIITDSAEEARKK